MQPRNWASRSPSFVAIQNSSRWRAAAQTIRYGPGISQLVEAKRHKNKHYLISDTIVLDQERCVVCWRCIRYLEEWEDKPQLGLFERGGATIIDIQPGQPVNAKTSGNIIDICPVGALTNRVARFSFRPWEIERTPSICTQCSIGCNTRLDTRTHTLRRVVGRENMQVNDQWICDKGRFANGWVNDEKRLTTPLVRKDGTLQPVSWPEALTLVAEKLQAIKSSAGADAIGGIGSAKLANESNYLLQRFMRQLIGTNNIDHRDGADIAALPSGLPALADLMKPQYGPDPKYDVIMLFGVDPSEELPILDLHLKRAVRRGKAQLIIAHPRRIELTRYNGPFMQYMPGGEVALLNGLLHLAAKAKEDKNSDAVKLVAKVTEKQLREVAGVEVDAAKRAVELLANAKNALIIYGPMPARGANGVQVRQALQNLANYTGHGERLAYVGLDANSQGCRDMGVLPNALPGHVGLEDELGRPHLEQLWGVTLPVTPGKSYSQLLDSAGDSIKALYIMGADPASERPNWAANLDKLDFLVVQEIFLTETAQMADVVLPAVSWAEGNGTFTNLERRVQRAAKALGNPQTKAAPDWMILDHLAGQFDANWAHDSAQSVTAEISHAVPLYAGMTWNAIGDQGRQWDAFGLRTSDDYAAAEQPVLTAEAGELRLMDGTVLYDGGTLFGLTRQLSNVAFGLHVAVNPADAARLGLEDGTAVKVRNRYGILTLSLKLDATVKAGVAWIPASLAGAPVGALLNGGLEVVSIEKTDN
ncbi:MAG: molybdopterin-dependent oxidoreductase [Anaerolineales bacterium]|nr:molybdopterin-dependent oxidoreductase [Anaerolineales bacterium]